MREKKLLHNLFEVSSLKIDKRVSRTLFDAVEALIKGKQLSIFGLARSLSRESMVKHNIKCINRLFGNKTLHKKMTVYYQQMINILLSGKVRPVMVAERLNTLSTGGGSAASKRVGSNINSSNSFFIMDKYSTTIWRKKVE